MYTNTAYDFAPKAYTEKQANFITVLCEERDITPAQLMAVFPKRPTTAKEASNVISWLKGQPLPVKFGELKNPIPANGTPSLPSSPQAAIATRRDKSGKAMPSYYAVEMDGTLKFYRVKAGRKAGFYFIEAQASDEMYPVRNYEAKKAIVAAIISAGPEQAMKRYGQELGHCGHCHRTLTDETSRALGIGPVCRADM